MARPRCEDCERFARFIVVIPDEPKVETCKPCGWKRTHAALDAGKAVRFYEAFDAAWQGIIWREIKP